MDDFSDKIKKLQERVKQLSSSMEQSKPDILQKDVVSFADKKKQLAADKPAQTSAPTGGGSVTKLKDFTAKVRAKAANAQAPAGGNVDPIARAEHHRNRRNEKPLSPSGNSSNVRQLGIATKPEPEVKDPHGVMSHEPHNEPYKGDLHNLTWSGHPSKGQPVKAMMNVDPQGHLGKEVASGGSDPFMWLDTKYGATKKVLQEHAGKPLKISTRSDLIAHDDYIQHLDKKNHSIDIHTLGDNASSNRVLEPGAPSFKRRIQAYHKLKNLGYNVNLVHDKVAGLDDSINSLNQFEYKIPVRVNHIQTSPQALKNVEALTGIPSKVTGKL